jgi:hypothetical protein
MQAAVFMRDLKTVAEAAGLKEVLAPGWCTGVVQGFGVNLYQESAQKEATRRVPAF